MDYPNEEEDSLMHPRERFLIDRGWRFHLGDLAPKQTRWGWIKSGVFNQSGERALLDDSGWRVVDLPHDFVVEGNFAPSSETFGKGHDIPEMEFVTNLHHAHGDLPGGVAWYRKRLDIPASDAGRRIVVEFDGVFRDCEVYLNNFFIGRHQSGYTSFQFDVTDFLHYGAENVLAVRVDASEYEGWFYEGGGIYRHVWLTKTDAVHVAPWGVFVSAEPQAGVGSASAKVSVRTEVSSKQDGPFEGRLVSTVFDSLGREVARVESALVVPGWREVEMTQESEVESAELWSIEAPRLYTLRTEVVGDEGAVYIVDTTSGIRKIHFDPDKGFFLNDRPVKIQGMCCHQDHAGVGAALPDRLQEYRVEKLKEMGCNAYRTSHNPPTPELLEACDRLGMLVMDETRLLSSDPEHLRQMTDLVRRDRNHPSVILWSIGNEEFHLQAMEQAPRIAHTLKEAVRALDPTRLVTLAVVYWNPVEKDWDPVETLLPLADGKPLATRRNCFAFPAFSHSFLVFWHVTCTHDQRTDRQ
ncbi:hypothetical protein HQ520_12480 [bacterium]|nr:hypothetical protein [bacterium]